MNDTTGQMQIIVESAIEQINSVWISLHMEGIDIDRHGKDKNKPLPHVSYHLRAAEGHLQRLVNLMYEAWGTTDGQLCPYRDCCYELALPYEGWYICGNCQRPFWCRETDSDIENYHCYLPGKCIPEPPRPENIRIARVLRKSWASPSEDTEDRK